MLKICILLAAFASVAVCDFDVKMWFSNFTTPKGQLATGQCCDIHIYDDCNRLINYYHCDLTFKLCLEQITATGGLDVCSTPCKETGVIKDHADSIDFKSVGDYPIMQTFKGAVDGFKLKVYVGDVDTIKTETVVNYVDEYDYRGTHGVSIGTIYEKQSIGKRSKALNTDFNYRYQVLCSHGWSGPLCDKETKKVGEKRD